MKKIISNLVRSFEFYQEERWLTCCKMSSRQTLPWRHKAYCEPRDHFALLWQMHKWRRTDVSRSTFGNLAAALGSIKSKTHRSTVSHDMLFPPKEAQAGQQMIPGYALLMIQSIERHIALHGYEPSCIEQVNTFSEELLALQNKCQGICYQGNV